MAVFNFQILLLYSSLSLFFWSLFPQTHSLSFNLKNIGPEHQNVNITTFRDASISSEGLQLTPTKNIDQLLLFREGKAQWATSLHLWDNSTGNLADFETHFVFVINSDGNPYFADGLTFFLADPIGSDISPAYAMGLPVNRDTFMGTSSFVAVEFDTCWNGPPVPVDPYDINGSPHVGIDVNSIISSKTAVWYCNVPEWVTFGFSAATGGSFEKHTVISWEFSSSLQIDPVDPGPKKFPFGALVGIVISLVVLVGGFGWVGFDLWKRSRENGKDKSEVELPKKNEDEDGPMLKDTFGELPRAPKLKDRRFGVYRDFLRELNSYFAVETTNQSDAH